MLHSSTDIVPRSSETARDSTRPNVKTRRHRRKKSRERVSPKEPRSFEPYTMIANDNSRALLASSMIAQRKRIRGRIKDDCAQLRKIQQLQWFPLVHIAGHEKIKDEIVVRSAATRLCECIRTGDVSFVQEVRSVVHTYSHSRSYAHMHTHTRTHSLTLTHTRII